LSAKQPAQRQLPGQHPEGKRISRCHRDLSGGVPAAHAHRIVVEADSARFEMQIENVPTDENPRTGKITALWVIAALRGLTATLSVGS
jgi:hypothetical protein